MLMAAPQPNPESTAPHNPSSSHPPPSPFRSPSCGPVCRALSLLGAKITHPLSSAPEHGQGESVLASSMGLSTAHYWAGLGHGQRKTFADDESTLNEEKERSVSRGRDAFVSSGRGGLGNIRQSSLSRDARPVSGPDDFSDSRGREPKQELAHIFSTGRGGAGNIRSPSRDVGVVRSGADDKDQQVIRSHIVVDHELGVHSTGRGGIGNITGGSRSRSRARDSLAGSGTHTPAHSTGRGGAGNIFPGAAPHEVDELLAAKGLHNAHGDDIHSTGRGGAANITHAHSPPVEHSHHEHHHGDFESTGRGGAGNIVRE